MKIEKTTIQPPPSPPPVEEVVIITLTKAEALVLRDIHGCLNLNAFSERGRKELYAPSYRLYNKLEDAFGHRSKAYTDANEIEKAFK